jgi:hypothetical protein
MIRPRWLHKQLIRPGKITLVSFKRASSLYPQHSHKFFCGILSKKCFKKECTGACVRGFCEEPDPPSRTRYTTVHHVPPLVEHAGHDLPHPPACIAAFAGMKLHFQRHASPNSPACIADVAGIRLRSCQCTSPHWSKCIVAFFDKHTGVRQRPSPHSMASCEFGPVVRNIAAFHNKDISTGQLTATVSRLG